MPAPPNLLTFADAFDDAAWVKATGGVGSLPVVTADQIAAPDGASTADKVVFAAPGSGDLSVLQQTVTTLVGSAYFADFWVMAFAAGDIAKQILLRHAAGGTYGLVTLTSDWQQVPARTEVAIATSSIMNIGLRPVVGGGSAGTVSCYLWRARMRYGSVQ